MALPLIEIAAPREPQVLSALAQARSGWQDHDALMFVSAAAVHHFFRNGVALSTEHPGHRTRFWAPGPGTARALAQSLIPLGVDASRIDTPPADALQFDSEHLWPMVQHQMVDGARLLVVRGVSPESEGTTTYGITGSGRDWLMDQCRARGARVATCVTYERRAPVWTEFQQSQAQAASGPDSVWLFSSSEAVGHLESLLPFARWSQAQALCTHERIATAAQAAGFGRVFTSRPSLEDVLCALELAQRSS
jgi:uroporphyrinogen-III synthase